MMAISSLSMHPSTLVAEATQFIFAWIALQGTNEQVDTTTSRVFNFTVKFQL